MANDKPFVVTYRVHGEKNSRNVWAANADEAKATVESGGATDVKVYE